MSVFVSRSLRSLLGVILLVSLALTVTNGYQAAVLAQTQSYTDFAINELSRRLAAVEGSRASEAADARLRVLESNMADIRKSQEENNLWIRSVAGAVLAQLMFAGIGFLRRPKGIS